MAMRAGAAAAPVAASLMGHVHSASACPLAAFATRVHAIEKQLAKPAGIASQLCAGARSSADHRGACGMAAAKAKRDQTVSAPAGGAHVPSSPGAADAGMLPVPGPASADPL